MNIREDVIYASNGLQGATSGIKKQWFDRVERVSDFPLYLYIVAGCAD